MTQIRGNFPHLWSRTHHCTCLNAKIHSVTGASSISEYAVVYHDGAFYLFGGWQSDTKTVIARLDASTTVWSKAGTLVTGRFFHNAVFDGENFLIIGGPGSLKTEVCSLSGQSVTCTETFNSLDDYYAYPELFLVPGDFGKDPSQC